MAVAQSDWPVCEAVAKFVLGDGDFCAIHCTFLRPEDGVHSEFVKSFMVAALALITPLCSHSDPAWIKYFEVTCDVSGSTMYAHAKDLPNGAEVSVEALPELNDSTNRSGIYYPSASLLPLSLGQHELHFEATFDGHTASSTCSVERRPFEVEPFSRSAQPEAFHRAIVSFTVTEAGGEPSEYTEYTETVGLDEARRYALVFRTEILASVTQGGAQLRPPWRPRSARPRASRWTTSTGTPHSSRSR